MQRPSVLIPVFAILFLVFLIGPPLLGYTFAPYPLLKIADVFDIFTPLVLLPFYWLLYHSIRQEKVNPGDIIAFLVLAGFWAEGQGMHLGANSIGHLLKGMENSSIYELTDFYDEVLGHYLWHFGIIGLSALLIYRRWRNPFRGETANRWLVLSAGVVHGFTLAVAFLEGVTWWMSIPLAAIIVLFLLVWARKGITQQPVLLFFFTSYAFALILMLFWGIWWRGLPEPMAALGI